MIESLIEKLKNIEVSSSKKPFSMLEMMYEHVRGKELVQSEMLASLLRPTENHGYGYELIKSFLQRIDVNFEPQKDSQLQVETERLVKDKRRIDILITWTQEEQKHAVIIENKLNNAPDQRNQLNDYHKSLLEEHYQVDRIVYMPLSKKARTSKDTDTDGEALLKTKDFDAQDLVDWIDGFMGNIDLSGDIKFQHSNHIKAYRDFLFCLISNQHIMEQAIEIQKGLSLEEIVKLEKLVKLIYSDEWSEVRVKAITDELKKDFPQMIIKGKNHLLKDSDCNNYVQLWFDDYKYWIELWVYPKEIRSYICTKEEMDEVTISGISFKKEETFNGYYYYHTNDRSSFIFDIKDNNGIVAALKPILKELSKYNK